MQRGIRTIGAAVMEGPDVPLIPVWAISASDPIFSTQYTAIKRVSIVNLFPQLSSKASTC